MLARIFLAAVALVAAVPAFAAADPANYMPAELIAETLAPKPGSTILVGFRMTPKPGWHGYWSNPGDSGIAPSVVWTAPPGVTFGPLLHPAPTLIAADRISSFVHEGPHILLSRMTVPRAMTPGTPIALQGKLSWAACTASQCVPLNATFTLNLVAGTGEKSSDADALQAAARKLPKPAPEGSFTVEGQTVRLLTPASLGLNPATTRFFPDDNDLFATGKGRTAAEGNATAISAPANGHLSDAISGVLSDGRNSYRLTFKRSTSAPSVEPGALHETEEAQVAPAVATPVPPAVPAQVAAQTQAEPQRGWRWAALAGIVLLLGAGAWFWRRR